MQNESICGATVTVTAHPPDRIEYVRIGVTWGRTVRMYCTVFEMHKDNPSDHQGSCQRTFSNGDKLMKDALHGELGGGYTRRSNPFGRMLGHLTGRKLADLVRKFGGSGIHLSTIGKRDCADRKLWYRMDVAKGVLHRSIAAIGNGKYHCGWVCTDSVKEGKRSQVGNALGGYGPDPSNRSRGDGERHQAVDFAWRKLGGVNLHVRGI